MIQAPSCPLCGYMMVLKVKQESGNWWACESKDCKYFKITNNGFIFVDNGKHKGRLIP